jgi:hypothetical protein
MKSPAFGRTVNASNYHGRRSISSSNQSKTASTGIKISVTQQMRDNRTVTSKTFFKRDGPTLSMS